MTIKFTINIGKFKPCTASANCQAERFNRTPMNGRKYSRNMGQTRAANCHGYNVVCNQKYGVHI